MAASLSLRVYTGAGQTQSSAQTGIDLCTADTATNSSGNRASFPITVGSNSYEKWLKLYVDTAPANGVTNFKIWGDGDVDSSTTLYFTANYVTYATPTTGTSSVAATDFTGYTASNQATWDTASYTATDATTRFAVFQLAVDGDAGPGNWTQETISYSYDET